MWKDEKKKIFNYFESCEIVVLIILSYSGSNGNIISMVTYKFDYRDNFWRVWVYCWEVGFGMCGFVIVLGNIYTLVCKYLSLSFVDF